MTLGASKERQSFKRISRDFYEQDTRLIPLCRGSNPPASASESVSNASHMKVAQKPRGTARFRRYELNSTPNSTAARRSSSSIRPTPSSFSYQAQLSTAVPVIECLTQEM